jgi:hypothetical protein
MTTDTEQLAADIKRVMELDAKRTQGDWLPFRWRQMPHGADPGEGGFINNGQLLFDGSENGHEEIGQFDADADLDFGASAPLMADIIRQLTDIVRVQHEALKSIHLHEEFLEEGCEIINEALALSAPLVKEV